MSRGKVKDPQGHQSTAYDFGYIQRVAETVKEVKKLKWPDNSEQTKSIPFLNKKKVGGKTPLYKVSDIGKDVKFESVEAVVYLESSLNGKKLKKRIRLGTIGVAILEEQLKKPKRKK